MKIELENEIYESDLELIQIEVTGHCNMHCKHCRASELPKKMITIEQMRKILEFANQVKSENMKITFSGGEPFLNKNLYDFILMAKENGFEEIVITTNASLLTDEWLKKLDDLKLKFLCIQVSLDSLNPEEHDLFRGYKGSFDKCNEVLDKIKNYKNLFSSIRMTVTSNTLNEIEKMIEFAIKKEVKILGIGSVIPFGNAANGNLSLKPEQKKEFIKTIALEREKNKNYLEIVTEDPLKFLYEYELGDLKVDLGDSCIFGGCTAGISSININSDGYITPCSMMEEKILNINDYNNINDIIKSYEKSEIIKKLFEKKYSGKCQNCILKRVCGGCRASAKAYTGSIYGSDKSCWKE